MVDCIWKLNKPSTAFTGINRSMIKVDSLSWLIVKYHRVEIKVVVLYCIVVGVKQHDILDLLHRSICSIVLGAIFDTKLGPSLRAGQYERMRRDDDKIHESLIANLYFVISRFLNNDVSVTFIPCALKVRNHSTRTGTDPTLPRDVVSSFHSFPVHFSWNSTAGFSVLPSVAATA